MAKWRDPSKVTPVKGPKLPKVRKPGTPKVQSTKASPPESGFKPMGRPKAGAGLARRAGVSPSAGRPGKVSAAPKPWYDPSNVAGRDASIAAALADPLKPVTGASAVAMARALAQSSTAPVLQDYDRQSALAQSRADAQSSRQATGTAALRNLIAQQLSSAQASQATARGRIEGAGAQLQASVNQGAQQAEQAAAQDAATRGAGLDGGSAAQRAQELANARARGQAGSQIALDQQAQSAQSGDQLLQQISATTAQQGGERQGAIVGALNSSLRDAQDGRAKALAAGEQQFLKTIMDLQSQNTQTALATETLGLNKEKATADTAIKTAQLDQQAKIAQLNAKIKVTEGAEQRALRKQLQAATDKQRALDRQARTSTADKNRQASNDRAAASVAARAAKDAAKPKALSSQDKQRRALITDVRTATATGQLAALKRKAKTAPQFRQLLLDELGVKDFLSRSILTDLQYGGLRSNTIAGYKAKYGRNPPKEWKRYRAPAASSGGGIVGSAKDALAAALGVK